MTVTIHFLSSEVTSVHFNILAGNKESQKTLFTDYLHFLLFSLECFLIMVFFKNGPSGVKIIIATIDLL